MFNYQSITQENTIKQYPSCLQKNGFSLTALSLIFSISVLASTMALAEDRDNDSFVRLPHTTLVAPLGHVSTNMVDATGRVVILHGLDIMQKVSPYYFTEFYNSDGMGGTLGQDWAKFYADNGFNVARVGIAWAGVEPSPGVYDDNYIRKIRDMVRMFGKYGVAVMLDFHQDGWSASFNGDMFPEWAANTILNGVPQTNSNSPYPNAVWENPALRAVWDNFWHNVPAANDNIGVQDRYINMYAHVVSHFKNEPNLLAYESINESSPDINTWTCLGSPTFPQYRALPGNVLSSCPTFFQTLLYQFNQKLNAKISSIDRIHMKGNALTFYEVILPKIPIVTAPIDPKVIMDRAAYRSTLSSTNSIALIDSQSIAKSNNTGFFVDEFGGVNDSLASLPSIVTFFDQNQVSWAYWVFEQGFGVRTATDGQSIIINRTLPPTDSNIDVPRLQAIVEPYPRVIAGTPLNYGYDSTSNTMTLSYSKIDVKGKEMPFFIPTEIFVPTRNYPNGYNVQVNGGFVISKSNSPILLLIRDPHASTVTVNVTSK